jgi:hypothetical protein
VETTIVDPVTIDPLQAPLVMPEVKDVPTLFAEAQAEIKKAGDETLTIEDRIGAFEKALEKLQSIRDEPEASKLPANLPELIGQCERELEKLRLRQFYP